MQQDISKPPLSVLDKHGEWRALSLKAIGVFTLIRSLDEGQGATFNQLNDCNPGGVTVLRGALKELELLGIIRRRIVREENGRHAGTYYDFFRDETGKAYPSLHDLKESIFRE